MTMAPDAVRTMFDRIAPVYDVMNRVMTAGLDLRWRRLAARAVVQPGDRVLDAACGTGDLAIADRKAGAEKVTGLDRVVGLPLAATVILFEKNPIFRSVSAMGPPSGDGTR